MSHYDCTHGYFGGGDCPDCDPKGYRDLQETAEGRKRRRVIAVRELALMLSLVSTVRDDSEVAYMADSVTRTLRYLLEA